jgi:hypothetical protein
MREKVESGKRESRWGRVRAGRGSFIQFKYSSMRPRVVHVVDDAIEILQAGTHSSLRCLGFVAVL